MNSVSIKEVGQNWTFPNDWEVGNNKIIGLGSGFGGLQQTISLQNKKIKVTFDILDYVSGTFRVPPTYRQDGLDERFSGNGSYEVIYTSLVDFFTFQPQLFDGSITNISVIEITDDTNLPRINYEGFSYQDALGSEEIVNGDFATDTNWNKGSSWTISGGKANLALSDNPTNSTLTSTGLVLDASKTYKISYNISNYVSGGLAFVTGNISIPSANGFHQFNYTGQSNFSIKRFGGASQLSIDNVSVKEVTEQEVVPDSGCGSWLFEPQSTNLITYSEDFPPINATTVESNYSLSPEGVNNSTKVSGADGTSRNQNNVQYTLLNLTSSTNYTFSLYVRSDNTTDVTLGLFDATTGANRKQSFAVTNAWQRFSFTAETGNSTTAFNVWIGGTSADIEVWGAQVEQQSYATSYIPTSGQASGVTRNQDLCNNGGSVASINSTEGVLYAEIAANSDDLTGRVISLSDGTSNERIVLSYNNSTNKIRCFIKSGGSFFATLDKVVADEKQFHKVAYKYKSGETKLFVDGNLVDTSTDAFTITGLDVLQFANGTTTTQPFFGKTKCVAVWKETLSDEELAELTTI